MAEFKKIILPILGVAVFICLVGYLYRNPPNPGPTSTLKQSPVKISNISLTVEEATSQEEREKGLSGKAGLEKDKGMLFTLGKTNSIPAFWMKGMKFAIDIVWILSSSGDVKKGKIIQIDKNVPVPEAGTPDSELKRYSPKIPVEYVLEVGAGFCDENKIKVGDNFEIQSGQ